MGRITTAGVYSSRRRCPRGPPLKTGHQPAAAAEAAVAARPGRLRRDDDHGSVRRQSWFARRRAW